MPYKNVSEAEKKNPGIRRLPPKAKRAWVAAFNSAKERGEDDETAAKIAWAAANRAMDKSASIEIHDEDIAIGIPFTKIDVKNRTVEGFATLDNVDKVGEIVDFEASRNAFRDWIGNIREMHGPKAVGKAIQVDERYYDDIETGERYNGLYVKAYISKGAQDTWEKVLDGTLRGFSVGGRVLEKRPEFIKSDSDVYAKRQVYRITKYVLTELSLVDNPANPLALFKGVAKTSLLKMDGDTIEASEIILKDDEEFYLMYCESCDIAKQSTTDDDRECPTCDGAMEVIATVYEVKDADEVRKIIDGYKFQKVNHLESDEGKRNKDDVNYHMSDGAYACASCKHFLPEMGKCELVAGEISSNALCDLFEESHKEVDITMEDVNDNLVEVTEKREFSDKERRRLADEGLAMPDGSYPIVTVEDLKNAIRAYGRAKDKEAVKRWIIHRARALGRTDLLPDDWKESMGKSETLQNNDTSINILDELAKLVHERMEKISRQEEGGDTDSVDKDSLVHILDILKTAVGNVEEILSKAGVIMLNDENVTNTDHVETVSLPSGGGDASPGKVTTDGVGATQEAWAETPSADNVLPHMGKAEDSEEAKSEDEQLALVKSMIGDEMKKLNEKLDTAFSAIESKFTEFVERLERVENSGAEKKSSEFNKSEELKKSQVSFWGGKFFSVEN